MPIDRPDAPASILSTDTMAMALSAADIEERTRGFRDGAPARSTVQGLDRGDETAPARS
jgi:hypothetical protein